MIKGNASEGSRPTLRQLREAAGFSQESLARQMEMSYQTIATWERGTNLPRLDKAAKLAKVLQVSFKDVAASIGIDVSGIPDDRPQSDQRQPAPLKDRPEKLEQPVPPGDYPELEQAAPPSVQLELEQPVPPGDYPELEQPAPPSDRPHLEPPAPPEVES